MAKNQNTAAAPIGAQTAKDIELALKKIRLKQSLANRYYRYYSGKHGVKFQSEKWKTKFGNQLKEFCENLCRVAVTTPSDRLEITGFTDEKSKSVNVDAWELWKYSSMPRLAKRLWREAFKTGDAYLVVWADENGKARMIPQDSRQCAVWYNGETFKVERGAKLWKDELDEKYYLTIYYRDRIEKFITKTKFAGSDMPQSATAFVVRDVPGETPEMLRNESRVCPMFHLGLENSILDDVIPLNDALNKEICDMMISSESNSRRERWTTGISYLNDPETNKPIIPYTDGEQWKTTERADAKFGEFMQVSLSPFMEAIKYFGGAVARVTKIPSYYFQLEKAAPPSGESLVKSEMPFTSLISDAQRDFGEPISGAIAFGLWIDNKANEKTLVENLIQVNWSPANPTTEKENVELANSKKNLGVDDQTLQSEIGYSDADIKLIATRKKAQTDAAAESFKKTFDAGAEIVPGA